MRNSFVIFSEKHKTPKGYTVFDRALQSIGVISATERLRSQTDKNLVVEPLQTNKNTDSVRGKQKYHRSTNVLDGINSAPVGVGIKRKKTNFKSKQTHL